MADTTEKSTKPVQTQLTPMLAQYLEIKRQYPDAVLFYRMGDFYEMFFEDATLAAPVLEVQLTSRDRNAKDPIPMCGVPYHAASGYVQKLLNQGLKVAICEQVEDPKSTKGLVKREVVRVVTPALIGDPELVSDDVRNILASLYEASPLEHEEEPVVEVAFLDLLQGEVRIGQVRSFRALTDILLEARPKEFLIPDALIGKKWFSDLKRLFPGAVITRRDQYFIPAKGAREAAAISALRSYLKETQKLDHVPHLLEPVTLCEAETLALDITTLSSLEMVAGLSGREGTTLFDIVNFTQTPMGKRTLRDWLLHPLGNLAKIEERHQAVEEFISRPNVRDEIKLSLGQIRDLERLTTKTALGLAMPRDVVAIREILLRIPDIQQALQKTHAPLLKKIAARMNPLKTLTETLVEALEDAAPATLRDGGIFRDSYHPDVAQYRHLSRDAKGTIAAIETREKTRTGIPSLKVKYSKVFGYTIEITKSYLGKVPSEYHRKQTIAGGERFVTEELKTFEEKVINAEHKLKTLEESLFLKLRSEIAAQSSALLSNARALAELDVLLSFAKASLERGYRRPALHGGWHLSIEEGRHPVVETLLDPGTFVPNTITFSQDECRTLIITGPNMGGKSTIMRQVALISILAQSGCFVPAQRAELPLLDAIFTRIGSSDDLGRGRSTFMVEMTEVARILDSASDRSLILIDEIGRGTSTYDGLSLAWALVEFIHTELRSKTLFATHFHEVTALETAFPGIKNVNVLVDRWNDEIVFLHRLGSGVCNQSYGVEVAKLAGLPSKVLLRAKSILGCLESQSDRGQRSRHRALISSDNQMGFFDGSAPSESRLPIGSQENANDPVDNQLG